jgi:protein TonB
LVLHLVFLWALRQTSGHGKVVSVVAPVVQQVSLLSADSPPSRQTLSKPTLKLEKSTPKTSTTSASPTQFALGERQPSPVSQRASSVVIAHSQALSAQAVSLQASVPKPSSQDVLPHASLAAARALPTTPNAVAASSGAANVALGKAQSTDNAAALGAPGSTAVTQGSGDAMPSSDALYLHNPKPNYPPISRRLNEQGRVVLQVFIGVDGIAQKATVQKSSGFERLDQAALATVLAWRYVPGRRAGVAQSMWLDVAINFVLE